MDGCASASPILLSDFTPRRLSLSGSWALLQHDPCCGSIGGRRPCLEGCLSGVHCFAPEQCKPGLPLLTRACSVLCASAAVRHARHFQAWRKKVQRAGPAVKPTMRVAGDVVNFEPNPITQLTEHGERWNWPSRESGTV
ncbi:uncharacterized protein LOC144142367 isoform X1 [Haemaphysalis longicornis]